MVHHRPRPTGGLVATWQHSSTPRSTPLNSRRQITASKLQPHLSDCTTFDINKYLYIYMSVWYCSCQSNTTLQYLHKTSYNIMFAIIDLLVISIFGSGSPMWLICPTPSIICLPYYLKFLILLILIKTLQPCCSSSGCTVVQ